LDLCSFQISEYLLEDQVACHGAFESSDLDLVDFQARFEEVGLREAPTLSSKIVSYKLLAKLLLKRKNT
jgi:hypothetical protein